MALFTPGQFRTSLQNKIKQVEDPVAVSAAPIAIKNNSQESFTQQAASYAANEMKSINAAVQSPRSTATLPRESIMNKSVHERMQSFVKSNNGK
jgi:hypothetical protein